MIVNNRIVAFDGAERWLSNFVGCSIDYQGRNFPSVEHAYQSMKQDSETWRQKCADYTITSAAIKKMAQEIDKRPDWNRIKLSVMRECVKLKFLQEPFRTRLIETGNMEIIEGNWWHDTFWGVDKDTMEGSNNLGKLIMEVRSSLLVTSLF